MIVGCEYVCACVCMCLHVCACACMYLHVCACVCMCVYICVSMYDITLRFTVSKIFWKLQVYGRYRDLRLRLQ